LTGGSRRRGVGFGRFSGRQCGQQFRRETTLSGVFADNHRDGLVTRLIGKLQFVPGGVDLADGAGECLK
jgi:hypothetical protein